MRTLRPVLLIILTLITSASIFFACQKTSDNPADNNTQDSLLLTSSANAQYQSDHVYNDVFDNVMGVNKEVGLGGGIGVFFKSSSPEGNPTSIIGGIDSTFCFNLTIEPETIGAFPKTITVDFGSGCTGKDGHIRKGKIITVYTGPMVMPGNTATTTFEQFYYDDVLVEGTHVIKNISTDANFIFTATIENGKLTKSDGDNITVNRTRTWTQTNGSDTPLFPLDDVYNITGSATGTTHQGSNAILWTTEITTPLVRKFTCKWIVSGEVKITCTNVTGTVDFGNGDCDNNAILTIGNKNYLIELP
jgi:hypothetical protein